MFRTYLGHDGLDRTVPEENLALAIDNVLLQVKSNQLGGAEIFHSLRHLEAHLIAHLEVCVDSVAGGEHDSRVVGEIYALATEFFGG